MKMIISLFIILVSFLSCASSREPKHYPLENDPFVIKEQKIMDILTSYRLETKELSYFYHDPIRDTIRLNAGIFYSYDRSWRTLVGLVINISIEYPYQYIGEDRDSYDSNKAVYYYIKESINNKFGEGFSFDNRKINDVDIQVFHDFLPQYDQTIEEISISYWIIDDDKLFLYLFLDKNGYIQTYINYGNNYHWNKYNK
jgi:hypothetical protein